MNSLDDIIAAIATPIGEGGISVIRVSGKGAIDLADRRFRGKRALGLATTHTAHFGCFKTLGGETIDEVVATIYHAPHSYTGEDCVEVSCHGGLFVTRKILEAIYDSGARPAEPGEFTKRAFLNGRMDLAQAEAVADMIHSRSDISHRSSLAQLQGRLSNKIAELRERILNFCSLLELELDFAEEGLEFTDKYKIMSELEDIHHSLSDLADSYQSGKVHRDGVKIVLIGRPNVGKSSILNCLLNEERAIVTEVPGTTRDLIEESIMISGILFRLFDCAGLRESDDLVEKEGIRRTEREIDQSDIIVFVTESHTGFLPEDREILEKAKKNKIDRKKFLIAVNKIDLNGRSDSEFPSETGEIDKVFVSAKTGDGFLTLKDHLVNLAIRDTHFLSESSITITSGRHHNSLVRACESLKEGMEDITVGKSNELVAVSLRRALGNLGEIIGLVTSEDIINNIFSKFCIGK